MKGRGKEQEKRKGKKREKEERGQREDGEEDREKRRAVVGLIHYRHPNSLCRHIQS